MNINHHPSIILFTAAVSSLSTLFPILVYCQQVKTALSNGNSVLARLLLMVKFLNFKNFVNNLQLFNTT